MPHGSSSSFPLSLSLLALFLLLSTWHESAEKAREDSAGQGKVKTGDAAGSVKGEHNKTGKPLLARVIAASRRGQDTPNKAAESLRRRSAEAAAAAQGMAGKVLEGAKLASEGAVERALQGADWASVKLREAYLKAGDVATDQYGAAKEGAGKVYDKALVTWKCVGASAGEDGARKVGEVGRHAADGCHRAGRGIGGRSDSPYKHAPVSFREGAGKEAVAEPIAEQVLSVAEWKAAADENKAKVMELEEKLEERQRRITKTEISFLETELEATTLRERLRLLRQYVRRGRP